MWYTVPIWCSGLGVGMVAAVAITRQTHTVEELRALAATVKDAGQSRRLLMIAHVLSGEGRAEAGAATGMDRQAVRDWVQRYTAEGPEGLHDRRRGGGECRLDASQLDRLRDWLEAGPEPDRDGVVRWRARDLAARIEEAFGVTYTEEGVRALLRREGFRQVTARPLHPRADGAVQGAFRDRFASLVRDTVGVRAAPAAPLEVWFQNEARVGQKGTLSRIWARKGDRPRIARDHRYRYRYLFGAACGALGKAVGLVAERANTAAMNAHLAAIAAAVTEGSHGVVVLDQAGWHKSKDLSVPDNLTLLLLPPTARS